MRLFGDFRQSCDPWSSGLIRIRRHGRVWTLFLRMSRGLSRNVSRRPAPAIIISSTVATKFHGPSNIGCFGPSAPGIPFPLLGLSLAHAIELRVTQGPTWHKGYFGSREAGWGCDNVCTSSSCRWGAVAMLLAQKHSRRRAKSAQWLPGIKRKAGFLIPTQHYGAPM